MAVKIRPYRPSDKATIVRLFYEFQGYIESLDSLDYSSPKPGFGEFYLKKMLLRLKKETGVFYVASSRGRILGFVMASIPKQEKEKTGYDQVRSGRVLELYVTTSRRGGGIGSQLLSKAENYLMSKGCNAIRLEVAGFNTRAHGWYKKLGYRNRVIDMARDLRQMHQIAKFQ